MFLVVDGPARGWDLQNADIVEGSFSGIEIRICPGGGQLCSTDGVGPGGLREIDCVANRGKLAVGVGGSVAAPGDIVNLLMQAAIKRVPAFDDLDPVEVGTFLLSHQIAGNTTSAKNQYG